MVTRNARKTSLQIERINSRQGFSYQMPFSRKLFTRRQERRAFSEAFDAVMNKA